MNIHEECLGRWESILNHFIPSHYLTGKHMECPCCKDGKDRFRIVRGNEKGRWFCNTCRPDGGSAIDLIMIVNGLNFKETCLEIRKILGVTKMNKPVQKKYPMQRLKLIHKGLKKVKRGDVVARYLKRRGIKKGADNIFTHTNIPYYGGEKIDGVFNAMVSRITNVNGELESYHIIYLTDDSKKIDFAPAKIIVTPRTTITGCSVQLGDAGEHLCIAEGVETAIMVQQEEGVTCWSSINASGMIKIEIPAHVKMVSIFIDNDDSFTGQSAGYQLARRLRAKGINVNVICDWGKGEDYLDFVNRTVVTDKADA